MGLWERLHFALSSPLGAIFFGLILFLALLMLAYWMLSLRQRKRDYYAYRHQTHYKAAESRMTGLSFSGPHKTDFFGRQTVVQFPDRSYGQCLIPPPELATPLIRNRFHTMRHGISTMPVFASYADFIDDEALIIVQKGAVRPDGRAYIGIKQVLSDQRFVLAERQQLLLTLARALAQLHNQRDENGAHLYHGFLLPRTGLLHFGTGSQLQDLVITDVGLACCFGPELICKRFANLRAGKLPIDRFCTHEILQQSVYLAPEQRTLSRLNEVGRSVDIYAFGALAIALFEYKHFLSSKQVRWDRIPVKWKIFLQGCLEDKPVNRPQDFLEIEDWLSDPELALMHADATGSGSISSMPDQAELTLSRLKKAEAPSLTPCSSNPQSLDEHLMIGQRAIKMAKWDTAKKSLKSALRIDPDNATANLNLAIALYELGDIKTSEKHVKAAQVLDPSAAKRFRQHIAFRL